ncbi:MAG: pyruvate kinase [Ilumatobacteraceae bacterium]|nr:pyruvate kinase [Ilumatobacteraceae bacterium]
MARRTKIVATIGPATDAPGVLERTLRAGVDVVRLNLSHGDLDEHLRRLRAVRECAAGIDRHVAVLADLPGPKIRAGHFPHGGVDLSPGSLIRLVPGPGTSNAGRISIPYPTLLDDLVVDSRVQLGDGAISLKVTDVGVDAAMARVETGGHTNGEPGVHLSSEALRLTTPTDEDLELAAAMCAEDIDFLAVSFVRAAADVDRVREVVGGETELVAKIETSAAIDALDEIIDASDAVMVARGDLGIDCPVEDVPHLQKRIIRRCVECGVPVITATQMLESMIHAPSPTRAEVSDVANAVFDGTDAIMLSGETAIGRDPEAVVTTMSAVAQRADAEASYRGWGQLLGRIERRHGQTDERFIDPITSAITHAAWQASHDVQAVAILCCTRSGRTAKAMARFRPEARLVGLAPEVATARALSMVWGVAPLQVEQYDTTDEMVWFAVERAMEHGYVGHGDTVVVLVGSPALRPDDGPRRWRPDGVATDVLRIVTLD